MRNALVFFPISAVFLLACSSASRPAQAGPPGDDAGMGDDANAADAAPDTGSSACASEQATPDQPCGTLSWATASAQSRLRNHHIALPVTSSTGQTSLVVLGGVNGIAILSFVDVAPIQADGSLGAFTSGPALPLALGGATGEAVHGVVVIAGGQSRTGFSKIVNTSVVQGDGTLAAWKAQASLPEPKMHAASFATGSRMFILGGFSYDAGTQSSTIYDDVIAGDVAADGTVASWTQVGKMPQAWTHMAVSQAAGYVYVAGGLHGDPYNNAPVVGDVERAHIAADGTLGEWTAMPKLPVPLATHSSFVYGGWLYEVGGIDDVPEQVKQVWRAPIQPDHSLGKWEAAASMPLGRGHVHKLPIVNDRVYSISGAIDFNLNSTPDIFIGSFAQ
jgi:hypothetical protein